MSSNKKERDDFDPKHSLVYLNSTAALMETMFKNMKNEDFVYPSKKEITADEGRVIRGEEHLKRQRETAMQHSLLVPDTYLESVLARMSDEDFTYGSQKPVDPNYGRVVRALELMEITGTSNETVKAVPVAVEKQPELEAVQKENVCNAVVGAEPKRQPDVTQQTKQSDNHPQVKQSRPNKSFGGHSKKPNNRSRVKYDLQTWRNDGCSFAKDQENDAKQVNKNKKQINEHSRRSTNGHQTANGNSHFYANPTFSPQNGMFNGFANNGTSQLPRTYRSGDSARENGNRNGSGGYNGYSHYNHIERRSMGGNVQTSTGPQMEFWTGGYNDSQQSWRQT